LVNQANDHGEITGSGVADSVAHDAKDRIEARLEQRCRHRRRAVEFRLRAAWRVSAAHWRAACMVGADDDGGGDRRVSRRRAALVHVYR